MKSPRWFAFGCVALLALLLGGCARAARDTTGFAVVTTGTVDAPFDATWQAAKAVLRERKLDIYTRDKRGVFVAYTPMKRRRLLLPKRVQYRFFLEPVSDDVTRVAIEAVQQVYGVTLLTYPGWHDRKMTDDTQAETLLEAIQAKVTGA